MSEHPKFLILTTNRTEDGAPVYAPCGDVRELIAEWREMAKDFYAVRYIADRYTVPEGVLNRCAEQLEATLKSHGDMLVARPLQIGVEYPPVEVKP